MIIATARLTPSTTTETAFINTAFDVLIEAQFPSMKHIQFQKESTLPGAQGSSIAVTGITDVTVHPHVAEHFRYALHQLFGIDIDVTFDAESPTGEYRSDELAAATEGFASRHALITARRNPIPVEH